MAGSEGPFLIQQDKNELFEENFPDPEKTDPNQAAKTIPDRTPGQRVFAQTHIWSPAYHYFTY